MKISTFLVFLALLVNFSSCSKWDFDKKVFPKCVTPSATLNFSTNQLQSSFNLTSVTGNIDKIEWFYGDGKTAVTAGYTTQYTYGTSGTYQASVQLSNKCGDLIILRTSVNVVNVTLPTVATLDPRNVKTTTAILGLLISNSGNGTIGQSGVCYSKTNSTPIIDNSLFVATPTQAVVGVSYNLDLTNLTPNSQYYARAFSKNGAGIAYGATKTFQTGGLPLVTTLTADNISPTKVTLSLRIDDIGNPVLNRYGVMLSSTSSDPGRVGNYSYFYNDANGNVANLLGTVASYGIEGLMPNTTYYYRGYATNSEGTFYSQVNSFYTSPSVSINNGLVVYLPLDGNAVDFSANNFATTVWGNNTALGTTDRKGVSNGAMSFNGNDNYIAIGDSPSLRTPSMSISCWMKPNNTTNKSRMNIIGKTDFSSSQGEQYNFGLNFNASRLFTYTSSIKQNSNCITPGQNWQNMAVGAFAASGWYHIAYTFENGAGKMYVNGNLVVANSDYPSKVIDNCVGGNLRIGAWWKDYPDYFQGSLDEVRLYNRALTLDEVKILYNQ